MKRARFIRSASAAAVAPAVAGAASPAQAQAAPITIGASLSLTGIFADGGKYSLEGYQLWIKAANSKGGVLGRPLTLKFYDDQSEPSTGVRLYERLINEDKVDIIMGPYGTAITAPAANVAERYKMPMICPETADVAMFRRGFKYIFQALGPVQTYLYGVLQVARDHGLRKLALIGPDTAFAHSLVDAVPEIARGFGQSIVFSEFYPARASDFASVIEKVKGANPDVLLAMAFPNDSIGVLRQLKQSNYAPKIVYEAIGASDPRYVQSAGKDVDGVFSVTAWDPDARTPENSAFKSAYRARVQARSRLPQRQQLLGAAGARGGAEARRVARPREAPHRAVGGARSHAHRRLPRRSQHRHPARLHVVHPAVAERQAGDRVSGQRRARQADRAVPVVERAVGRWLR